MIKIINTITEYPILIFYFFIMIAILISVYLIIKHRRETTKIAIFSILVIMFGGMCLLIYRTMWYINVFSEIQKIAGIVSLFTFVPGLLLLYIYGYIKIRSDPFKKKLMLIIFGFMIVCLIGMAFITIMKNYAD